MDIALLTVVIIVSVMTLLALGVPFAFAAGAVAAVIAFAEFGSGGLNLLASRTYDLLYSYTMVAVPMFILMASLLERSTIARDLFSAFRVWAGPVPGGVGAMTMVVAVILAATTGIIGGEVVMLGLLALPQMLRLGYDRKIAIGTICAGGALGTMVPPSIILIFYGMMANVSISHLFLATTVPALLLVIAYMIYILVRCTLNPSLGPPAPAEDRNMPLGAKIRLLSGIVLPMGIILCVLGSIYLGIASITESAALGVIGVLFSAAVRGELTRDLVVGALKQTLLASGIVIWLVFGTNALVGIYNVLGGIRFMQDIITGMDLGPLGTVAIIITVLLVLGMFIDWIGILFLTLPIALPIVVSFGYDALWYGVIFNLAMQIAYLTPPFAPAAFYLKSVAPPDITIEEIYNSMWPFIGIQAVILIAIVLFPELVLWLPRAMYG